MTTKKKVPEKKVAKKMTCLVCGSEGTWLFDSLEKAVNCLSKEYTKEELMEEFDYYVVHNDEIMKVLHLSLISKGISVEEFVLEAVAEGEN